MLSFKPKRIIQSRITLLRALRLTLWGVPTMMAIIGIIFTLFENARHAGEPIWPWPTVFGLLVLGLMGPLLSWLSLFWTIRTAEAYIASEEELAQRNSELAALNALG